MSDNAPTAAPAAPAAPEKKKSGAMKWIVIGLAALLLLGGGGGAAWWFFLRTPPAAAAEGEGAEEGGAPAEEKKAEKEKKPKGDGLIAMDQFLVNLADEGAQRFVRVKLGLVVESKEEGVKLSEEEVVKARLRSAILEVLAQQTADHIVTPDGKAELKKVILEKANAALGEKKVLDVLFTDFVVQF
jgi:flagellar protein FliL